MENNTFDSAMTKQPDGCITPLVIQKIPHKQEAGFSEFEPRAERICSKLLAVRMRVPVELAVD